MKTYSCMKNVSKGAGEDLLCAYIPDYNDTPWIMALSVSVCERAISVNIFFFSLTFALNAESDGFVLPYSRITLNKAELQKTHTGALRRRSLCLLCLQTIFGKCQISFFMKSRREGRLFQTPRNNKGSHLKATSVTWSNCCDANICFYCVWTPCVCVCVCVWDSAHKARLPYYFIACISSSRLPLAHCKAWRCLFYNASKITHQQNSPDQQWSSQNCGQSCTKKPPLI